jgi:hypothetical protein
VVRWWVVAAFVVAVPACAVQVGADVSEVWSDGLGDDVVDCV